MIVGFFDPVWRWVFLAILLVVAAGVLALIWLMIRAVSRTFGLGNRTQVIAIILVVLFCGGAIALWLDLDDLEKRCRSEFMTSPHAAGASRIDIRKHVNLWKGWSNAFWGYTEPNVDPRVMLWIWFSRDERMHYTRVTCHFTKIVDSGEPPQLQFDKLEIAEPSLP